ncbi:GntP family permease [Salibacterium halotolerans]|uniref:Gluconate:H+ symporter, GntP family/Gnt-I system low-affinity gluconate transporter n=1 Tax=Salibacterium halotolerans TaxID=1884432 RepID=A0A1I5RTB8_9BACI|nr:SLC13 family permease [Salibacterium halotolerans]SFP61733.1 gluconate:H+ symporter, GntP family/Gnt-I system low-affinity gluconate transporter [Salibacterium halotolerans]
MSDDVQLLVYLALSLGVLLLIVLKFNINAAIALIFASLFMGIASGLGLMGTLGGITEGFGGMMGELGIPIGLGVILGKLISDSGGAYSIATSILNRSSEKLAFYSLGAASFVLAIPVFFDVAFIILVPLAVQIGKQLNKPLPYSVGSIIVGAAIAHTLVPPTPNPLASASIFGFDLGIMLVVGAIIGMVATLLTIKIYFIILDKGFWKAETDEDQAMENPYGSLDIPSNPPSALMALIPIILPSLMIVIGSFGNVFFEENPAIVSFLSHRIIALLVGTIAAYFVAAKSLNKQRRDNSSSEAMQVAGIVFLITGAGGAFGTIIQNTGIDEAIKNIFVSDAQTTISVLLVAFFMGVLFRTITGSGTVAGITTMTIMAGVVTGMDVHPVWVAMASLSGGLMLGHVNDSGFWITTKIAGLSMKGGLKTYTTSEAISGIVVLLITIIGAHIF